MVVEVVDGSIGLLDVVDGSLLDVVVDDVVVDGVSVATDPPPGPPGPPGAGALLLSPW